MFEQLPTKFDFAQAEKQVLEYWDRHRIFARSLEQRAGAPRFVFFEGPPTANGLPHPGHALTRAVKDLFPRYRTMTGNLVERKAGWDTHGLPVEVEVCKELGIHSKEEIVAFGVEKFNLLCIRSVFRYTREWEEMTRRLGFWVNLDEAYVTYHKSYVESVWWSLKTLFERGLLYQGHKVVWWWAQGGTALSSGEVGEGYRAVDDPSVFVKFPLLNGAVQADAPAGTRERCSLLVWTTTPWTLLSNHFAAVHPDLEYALVEDPGADGAEPEYLYIASVLVPDIARKVKRELRTISTCLGKDLVGARYLPPFDCYYNETPGEATMVFGLGLALEVLFGHHPPRTRLGDLTAALKAGGQAPIGWRVLAADFVTTESGTGLVHEAPAFGEVDFNLLQQERARFTDPGALPLLCAVAPDGTFTPDAPEKYRGRWVKDCDKDIIRELRDERRTPWGSPVLSHQETYRHDYPFCPRSENDALIQYARKSWFVRTSQFKDDFLENNRHVGWLPEHIREGRFGDFLRNNVDWALSRERFWGTPLPIWVCESCSRMQAIGSLKDLESQPGASDATPEHPEGFWAAKTREHEAAGDPLPEHLRVHKPYIDAWTFDCPHCRSAGRAARMRRAPEVIDCWWDAGSMPFAQWGFPHAPGSAQRLAERYPADFISEAIDQTRGWFYGLLSISTLLSRSGAFQADAGARENLSRYPLPFRNCIVLGHMMGEDGNKMSKRLRNYKEPSYIFDNYGADAMRWYFFSAQAPWTTVRFQESAIRDAQREFLVKLYNVLSFFNIYADIDGFTVEPGATSGAAGGPGRSRTWRPVAERSELDRWVISELHRTIALVRERLDAFENFPAAQRLNDFVDALSNWYVRRSRDRFWQPSGEAQQSKWDAYHTLYECLLTLSRLIAPFTPFFAEVMYLNLAVGRVKRDDPSGTAADGNGPSVHLCNYPEADAALIDRELLEEMDLVREVVSLGRAARTEAKLKVRQPLAEVELILARPEHQQSLRRHVGLIAEELNVKAVQFTQAADHYVTYEIRPDFKAIGPKFGKLAPRIAAALKKVDPAASRSTLMQTGALPLEVDGQTLTLTPAEVEIRLKAKPGWSAAQGPVGVVVLKTDVSPELREEGVVRELIHHVQALRKEMDLPYQARIALRIAAADEFAAIVRRFEPLLTEECLVQALKLTGPIAGEMRSIEGFDVNLAVERV